MNKSKKQTLCQAALSIYEQKSLKFSDCFDLTNLNDADELWFADNDEDLHTTAQQLKQLVEKRYQHPVDLKQIEANPLVELNYRILHMLEQPRTKKIILVCSAADADLVEKTLNLKPELNNPPFKICNIEEFSKDSIIETIGIAPLHYRGRVSHCVQYPYRAFSGKKIKKAANLVVYLSDPDSWIPAAYLWHEIVHTHSTAARILVVNDLNNQTTTQNCAQIYKCLGNVFRRLYVKAEFEFLSLELAGLVVDRIADQQAIIVMPQLKSYAVSEYRKLSGQISFYLCEADLAEIFQLCGSIGCQALYNEIVKFTMLQPVTPEDLVFRKMYKAHVFPDWRMRFYWFVRKLNMRIWMYLETNMNKQSLNRRYY